MSAWVKPKPSRVGTTRCYQGPRSSFPPTLKITLTLLKIPLHQMFLRSLITSLWISFTILTRGISVLCITKNSINSWRNSCKIIDFFIPTCITNSSTSCLTTLQITKTYVVCGKTDAYLLEHPYVSALLPERRAFLIPKNGDYAKSNTSLSKFM